MVGIEAFVLAFVLTPLVLVIFKRVGVLDHPNERSSHDRPIVRGGGVAVAVACLAAASTSLMRAEQSGGFGIVAAAAGFGIIGLIEDVKGVPTLPRFGLQAVVAALSLHWLLHGLAGSSAWQVVFAAGVLFWLIAYVNAFNFMDGVNGISAAQSLVAGLAWAWLGRHYHLDPLMWGGSILAGAALGFAPFNFPRARVFLGDAGSYFIGGWQAALVVVGLRAGLPPEAVVAPLAIYLADTGTTIVRRYAAGEVLHQPHREHTYQRLLRQGWSHVGTTVVVGIHVAACALLGFLTTAGVAFRAFADVAIAIVIAAYLWLPNRRAKSTSYRARTV